MHAPITVNYVPDGDDWTVTVKDEDRTQSATASGLIAARDQADQIVEKMVPAQAGRTVVHLLEGDAVAFTNTYLQARLGLTPAPEQAPEAPAEAAAPEGAVPTPAAEPDTPRQPVETVAEEDKAPELAEVPQAQSAG